MLQVAKAASYPGEKEWQAKNDLQTLIEAEKIKKDSARIKAVKTCKRELEKSLRHV
jgi:hypothetical protein